MIHLAGFLLLEHLFSVTTIYDQPKFTFPFVWHQGTSSHYDLLFFVQAERPKPLLRGPERQAYHTRAV